MGNVRASDLGHVLLSPCCEFTNSILRGRTNDKQGLGCDSGGLLIYGVLSTVSWLLQMSSALISHGALLHYQRQHQKDPWYTFSKQRYKSRTLFHSFLCITAVLTRLTGKFIAVINGLWILAWSLMTYSNIMETPYCTTAYYSLHNHGWMRLWNFDPQQFIDNKIRDLWCLVFGSTVGYCACIVIFVLTSEEKHRKDRYRFAVVLFVGFVALVVVLTDQGLKGIRNLP